MRTRQINIGQFHLRCGAGWLFSIGWKHYGIEAYRADEYLWPSWTRIRSLGVRLIGVRWRVDLGDLSEPVFIARSDDRLTARFYAATERDVWPDVIDGQDSASVAALSRTTE